MAVVKSCVFGFLVQCLLLRPSMAADIQQSVSIREVKLNWDAQQASIIDIFAVIELNTSFKFSYDKKDFNGSAIINLAARNQSVADILLQVSKQAKLKFKQINSTINVIRLSPKEKYNSENAIEIITQTRKVSGRVTSSEDSEALPGVNIIEKGTTSGTITDIDGQYSLEVSVTVSERHF